MEERPGQEPVEFRMLTSEEQAPGSDESKRVLPEIQAFGERRRPIQRAFFHLARLIGPVDITGEAIIGADDLRSEDEAYVKVIDLNTGRGRAAHVAAWRSVRARLAKVGSGLPLRARLVLAGLAVVMMAGVFAGWLLLSPQRTEAPPAPRPARVLLNELNQGGAHYLSWEDDRQYSNGGQILNCPARPNWQAGGHDKCGSSQLSFVNDWGKLFTWIEGTPASDLEFTLTPGMAFSDAVNTRWQWLYPGRYIISFKSTPGLPDPYRLWDARQGKILSTFSHFASLASGIPPFAITGDGWLAAVGGNGTLLIWNINAIVSPGGITSAITLKSPYFAHLIAFSWSPDGSQLATMAADGTLQIWRPFVSNPLWETFHLQRDPGLLPLVHVHLIWSPDGQRLLSDLFTGPNDPPLQIWDLLNSRQLQSSFVSNSNMQSLVWLDGHTKLLNGSLNGGFQVWNTTTGRRILNILLPHGISLVPSNAVEQVSLDKHWLLLPMGNSSIELVNLSTGKVLHTFSATGNNAILNMQFAPDGIQIALLDVDGWVRVWDARRNRVTMTYKLPVTFRKELMQFFDGSSLSWSISIEMAWSLDSRLLAVSSEKSGLVVLG